MKMTAREKVLIILLLIAAILAGSYYLVITPQLEKLDNLKADQEDLRIQVNTVKTELASIAQLRKGVEDMLATIDKDTVNYFPTILTEKILLMMDDLFIKNGLLVNSADFTSPAASKGSTSRSNNTNQKPGTALSLAEIRDKLMTLDSDAGTTPTPTPKPAVPVDPNLIQNSMNSLTEMKVILEYSAPYESITGFIAGLEALQRSLAVTNLTSLQAEDGTISGKIELVFFALPKITEQKDPYIEWPYTGEYGKPDPFAAPGYDVTVNVSAFAAGTKNLSLSAPAIAQTSLMSVEQGGVTEVELLLAPASGGYSSRFRIGTTLYPTAGGVNVLTTDKGIRVLVTSTPRIDAKDLSGIILIVKNTTALPVSVTVIGDDPVRPRVVMGTFEGAVTVRK